MKKLILLVCVGLLVVSCAHNKAGLPRSKEIDGPWDTYKNMDFFYNTIEKGAAFSSINIDGVPFPEVQGVTELSDLDLIPILMPRDSITFDMLDASVQECLKDGENCVGYLMDAKRINIESFGNFFADTLGFTNNKDTNGWLTKILFVVHKDVVIFKRRSPNRPNIGDIKKSTKPFGFLQNSFKNLGEKSVEKAIF